MKNQRIKADNVDQLLEIVRAVQRGEDPGEALEKAKAEKERAEAIAMAETLTAADLEESLPEKNKPERRKNFRKKKTESEQENLELSEEEDEFEKALEDEGEENLPLRETAGNMKGGLKKAVSRFLRSSEKKEKRDKKRKDAMEEALSEIESNAESMMQETDLKTDLKADLEQDAEQMLDNAKEDLPDTALEQEIGQGELADTVSEMKSELKAEQKPETPEYLFGFGAGGGRMLGRERLSSSSKYKEEFPKDTEQKNTEQKNTEQKNTEQKTSEKTAADQNAVKAEEKAEGNVEEVSDNASEQQKKNSLDIGTLLAGWFEKRKKAAAEKTEDNSKEVLEEKEDISEEKEDNLEDILKGKEDNPEGVLEGKEDSPEGMSEEKDGDSEDELKDNPGESESDESVKISQTRKLPSVEHIKERLQNIKSSKRSLVILAVIVFLVILLAVAAIMMIQRVTEQREKQRNVTADKGLIVTVEKEPQEWCRSYMVELRFKTKGKPVTKVIINGTAFQPDAEGNVVCAAEDYRLEATAVTEDTAYEAVIEIPKLDAQPPTVYAQRSAGDVVLTATDDRSSIKKLWYAELKDNDFIRLPIYQEYIGAIPYQEGSLYYFYAEDAAGNSSVPVITTMELTEKIQFSEETLMMYPDETVYLNVEEIPSGALVNNLQFSSSDPSVAVLDAYGNVTALAEGTARITARADGVEEIYCDVEVARERTVTISAIGDCTLGTDISFNTNVNFTAYALMNDSSYFFEKVADILENDDVTFANLEGTLTNSNAREVKQYAFKGDPSYTDILNSGSVEVVTLANNHSRDYGEQSLTDTQKYLTEAGIDYCMGDTYVLKSVNGVKTAFIGIYVLRDGLECETQVRETIAAAKADGADLVVVGFHWGSEKATEPDETQKTLAHTAVDCGADLVVGHHPHVLQGIEKYNGKYIAYSLGNFCFGGNTAPSDTDTMIFRQTFTIRDGSVEEDDQIEIIPCSVTSAYGYNNYQPIPVDEANAQRIMERINTYSEAFNQSYTASTGLE